MVRSVIHMPWLYFMGCNIFVIQLCVAWHSSSKKMSASSGSYSTSHGPLTRYVKLRVAYAPGMPGTFSPPPRFSDPHMHHGTCVTHIPWCMPGSLTSGFLWSRWREKFSRHSRRMRNAQFYVSGKEIHAITISHGSHSSSKAMINDNELLSLRWCWDTLGLCRPTYITLMVVDALLTNRRQVIGNHHPDSTETTVLN